MYLMMVGGVLVCCKLCTIVRGLTVSKAYDMSSVIVIWGVFFGGLEPVAMMLMWCSDVVVDRCGLKPCCCSFRVVFFVICGRMFF